MPFREVEHTADLALQVSANELSDLFRDACRGMFWLEYGDLPEYQATDWRTVTISGSGYEMLLVEWLNELLYIAEHDKLCVTDTRILSLSEGEIRSCIAVQPAPVSFHDIKAVTYSDLALKHIDGVFEVLLTFDV